MDFSIVAKKIGSGLLFLIMAFPVLSFVECTPKHDITSSSLSVINPNKGLKDYYKDYFPIGVAVSMASLHGPDSALIVKEFNSVTPEMI